MAGYERLKARGTAGFKRNVRTNGYMAVMSQGQKDAHREARLNAYLSDAERQAIQTHGVRRLKFIGKPQGKPMVKPAQPKVKEFKGPVKANLPTLDLRTHTVWGTKISRLQS